MPSRTPGRRRQLPRAGRTPVPAVGDRGGGRTDGASWSWRARRCRQVGVRVFSLAPDCLDADAFSTTYSGTPYVFLNTRKTGERGRFDAAHELGHLVLHSEHRILGGREDEPEANAFASAFLMPRAGILAQQLNDASVERFLSAKRRWGVSFMALTYRLRDLGLLSEWRYTQTTKKLAQLGYRTGEPNSLLARESSQLLAKVFDALGAKDMTPVGVADQMGIHPEDLNDYVFGLVPVSLDGGGPPQLPAVPTSGSSTGTQPSRPGLRPDDLAPATSRPALPACAGDCAIRTGLVREMPAQQTCGSTEDGMEARERGGKEGGARAAASRPMIRTSHYWDH
ncbi:ImmA/IrrE family metallo-endopeptidase [Streptomyces collinus]|uniref:ImmA/IrrE family metallo-endopeptidase n=1 Tax=Streptomyces collinus TaxID=42684 RepID=UPI0033F09746